MESATRLKGTTPMSTLPAPHPRVTHPIRRTLSRVFLPWKEISRLEAAFAAERAAKRAIGKVLADYRQAA